jgi:hypothetical protein
MVTLIQSVLLPVIARRASLVEDTTAVVTLLPLGEIVHAAKVFQRENVGSIMRRDRSVEYNQFGVFDLDQVKLVDGNLVSSSEQDIFLDLTVRGDAFNVTAVYLSAGTCSGAPHFGTCWLPQPSSNSVLRLSLLAVEDSNTGN